MQTSFFDYSLQYKGGKKSTKFLSEMKELIPFETIEKLEVEHISGESVTISAGLVVQSAQYLEDEDKLYKYADDALYKAKEQGRNQVVLSEHSR